MKNLVDLKGRRILVTGASSGIGSATAILLSQLGASVILTARDKARLNETLGAMTEPDSHQIIVADLAKPQAVKSIVHEVGPVSGLVHAAGLCPISLIAAQDEAERDLSLRVNYLAFLDLMALYARPQNRQDPFSAVAVASVSSEAGWPGGAAYCGSKGALVASVRALALELAPKGVRVNAVSPANIRTPLLEAQAAAIGHDLDGRKIGLPEDVAGAIAFLLSPAANFITGVNLPVDGGYLAQ